MRLIPLAVAFTALPLISPCSVKVDFTADGGRLERALHSSGFAPALSPRPRPGTDEAELKPFGFFAARTHDWALVNAGQRVVDTHFIFPLMHLDARDPKNYVFGPTDEALRLARDMGLKIFYRLGSSIEHTEDGHHWNIVVKPDDVAQYAEACAGIVRHYTQGWADGFRWDIPYWEIWNEPDNKHCWGDGSLNWKDPKRRAEFCRFFAFVLKRLKSEFPSLKFGGPALVRIREEWFDELIGACAAAGVKPDFLSWHAYQHDADDLVAQPARMRKYLDAKGLFETKLVIDEWHFLGKLGWKGMATWATDEDRRTALEGPAGHNGIDSAAFVLNVLSRWQDTPLDQAFYYGIRRCGNWGYMDEKAHPTKVCHALRLYGQMVNGDSRARAVPDRGTVSALAVRKGAAKRILVADYLGTDGEIVLGVKGVAPDAQARVELLDWTHDLSVESARLQDGSLTLKKAFGGSTAWMVTFDSE